MSPDILITALGWLGSVAVLLAYGLNAYQKLDSKSPWFYFLNLIGGTFLIVYTYVEEAYASTFINVVWVLIALGVIIRSKLRKEGA